jgi:hypothetical protein
MNNDREHLRVLSILHFILAALLACGVCLGGLWGIVVTGLFRHGLREAAQRGEDLPVRGVFTLVVVFWIVMLVIALVYIAALVFAGFNLRARRNRTFCMVVAALTCVSFPLGTALGVFTLIVLSRDSVRELYGEGPNAARPS